MGHITKNPKWSEFDNNFDANISIDKTFDTKFDINIPFEANFDTCITNTNMNEDKFEGTSMDPPPFEANFDTSVFDNNFKVYILSISIIIFNNSHQNYFARNKVLRT